MTDENPVPEPTVAPESGAAMPGAEPATSAQPSPASDAWSDVVARLSELGVALSAWAKTAADDPQNQQRLAQIRGGVDEMARQADAAFSRVASSDLGQQVAQGAQQAGGAIGDAAQQVSTAAAPHLASAFSGLASMFDKAASKVDEAVSRANAPAAPPEASPASQAPPVAPSPSTPVEAPSPESAQRAPDDQS